MVDVDLSGKGWVILGLRGSGKSVLAHHILMSSPRHLVYDPHREYSPAIYRRYGPTDRNSSAELDKLINDLVIPWRPDIFVIDEANRYAGRGRLPGGMQDLVDNARHWRISFGCIARRPTQFNTDVVELADYIFLFNLSGKNDHRYLNDLSRGLGDTVQTLPAFHFCVVDQQRNYVVHRPVSMAGQDLTVPKLSS